MWRMLDDPELREERHQELFKFVLAEWDTFRDFNLTFYGSGKEGIANFKARIEDPTFPESKKWIYLCCAPSVIEDPTEAEELVNLGLSMSDPFTREVAVTLLQRFFPDKGESGNGR